MGADQGAILAHLAAEVRRDLEDLERLAGHAEEGVRRLAQPNPDVFVVFGVGKVLHDFYAAAERLMLRVEGHFGGVPGEGPGWHRQLLEGATLDVPRVRPPLLQAGTAKKLDEFLRFRHRFRTLYAFDLEPEPMGTLLAKIPAAHAALAADVGRFLGFLERLVDTA